MHNADVDVGALRDLPVKAEAEKAEADERVAATMARQIFMVVMMVDNRSQRLPRQQEGKPTEEESVSKKG